MGEWDQGNPFPFFGYLFIPIVLYISKIVRTFAGELERMYHEMDIELIRQLEAANDGQTIHLFYDDMIGVYLAFGLSAYYSTMVVSPYMSYSDALKMPVALLNHNDIGNLRQSVTKVEHQRQTYYRFRLRTNVGTAGYDRWIKQMFGEKG